MNIPNKKTILFLSISTLMVNGCLSRHELRNTSPQRVVIVPSPVMQTKNPVQFQKSWKRFKPSVSKKINRSKRDCIDCYATPIQYPRASSVSKRTFASVPKRSFSVVAKKPFKISYNQYEPASEYSAPIDYSKPPSALKNTFKSSYSNNRRSSIKHYGSYAYSEKTSDKIASTGNYERKNLNSYLIPSFSGMNSSYNSNLSIQVGAFREYEGAKRYARRYSALSSKYRTTIKAERKDNQPIYRVQIEGFKSDMEAKRFMNSYGIEGAFLVRR